MASQAGCFEPRWKVEKLSPIEMFEARVLSRVCVGGAASQNLHFNSDTKHIFNTKHNEKYIQGITLVLRYWITYRRTYLFSLCDVVLIKHTEFIKNLTSWNLKCKNWARDFLTPQTAPWHLQILLGLNMADKELNWFKFLVVMIGTINQFPSKMVHSSSVWMKIPSSQLNFNLSGLSRRNVLRDVTPPLPQ